MKQKHIDAAREARLWILQIIGPALGILLMILPNTRDLIVSKAEEIISKLNLQK